MFVCVCSCSYLRVPPPLNRYAVSSQQASEYERRVKLLVKERTPAAHLAFVQTKCKKWPTSMVKYWLCDSRKMDPDYDSDLDETAISEDTTLSRAKDEGAWPGGGKRFFLMLHGQGG